MTVDYLTPMVDDPYLFGQIAAANALSDVFAMGGKPVLALNIAGLPSCLPVEAISAIMRGGADKVIEAGAIIGGGHTIQDDEPKYGLVAVGLVHPEQVLSNATAQPGELLILTKPLGTGIINTAIKGGLASDKVYRAAVEQMSTLNSGASECVRDAGARTCTDITGFGFLGHAAEVARASRVSLVVNSRNIPLLPETLEFARMGLIPAGAYDNRRFLNEEVAFSDDVPHEVQDALFDPQTSGGLLVSAEPGLAAEIMKALPDKGIASAAIVGKVVAAEANLIRVL